MKHLYQFWGKVRKGKKRGKRLGFPTVNLVLRKKIPEGIYISQTKIKGKVYPSLTFIGSAKTFNETAHKAETYILSFNKPLYHTWISVELLKKIRNVQKFNSKSDLIKQIQKDIKKTESFLTNNF